MNSLFRGGVLEYFPVMVKFFSVLHALLYYDGGKSLRYRLQKNLQSFVLAHISTSLCLSYATWHIPTQVIRLGKRRSIQVNPSSPFQQVKAEKIPSSFSSQETVVENIWTGFGLRLMKFSPKDALVIILNSTKIRIHILQVNWLMYGCTPDFLQVLSQGITRHRGRLLKHRTSIISFFMPSRALFYHLLHTQIHELTLRVRRMLQKINDHR